MLINLMGEFFHNACDYIQKCIYNVIIYIYNQYVAHFKYLTISFVNHTLIKLLI